MPHSFKPHLSLLIIVLCTMAQIQPVVTGDDRSGSVDYRDIPYDKYLYFSN